MDFKHKKTCSISFMIKGMKIKITQISFAYIWQKLKFLQNLNDQGHWGTSRHSHRLLATKGYKALGRGISLETKWPSNPEAYNKDSDKRQTAPCTRVLTATLRKGKRLEIAKWPLVKSEWRNHSSTQQLENEDLYIVLSFFSYTLFFCDLQVYYAHIINRGKRVCISVYVLVCCKITHTQRHIHMHPIYSERSHTSTHTDTACICAYIFKKYQ